MCVHVLRQGFRAYQPLDKLGKSKISEESRKTLKRGIKKYGLVGGVAVNKRTGLTVETGQDEAGKAAKQLERDGKVSHMKEVKRQVKEDARKQAEDMDAYEARGGRKPKFDYASVDFLSWRSMPKKDSRIRK